MRKSTVLPLVIFCLLLGIFGWRLVLMIGGYMPNDMKTIMVGKQSPDFAMPPLYDGQKGFSSNDLQGKVTLVNFFASWCQPCRMEHPLLSQMKNKVTLVGIAYKNRPEETRVWLARLGNPYDFVVTDLEGQVGVNFGVYGVPESYLIDRNGVIRAAWKKSLTDKEIRESVIPMISELSK